MDQVKIGKFVAECRKGKGLTQARLAEALGIHRTTLAYRLRRVQELTGLQLDDPRQAFHTAVSLKLMRDDGD